MILKTLDDYAQLKTGDKVFITYPTFLTIKEYTFYSLDIERLTVFLLNSDGHMYDFRIDSASIFSTDPLLSYHICLESFVISLEGKLKSLKKSFEIVSNHTNQTLQSLEDK